jgi:hypothetical protein
MIQFYLQTLQLRCKYSLIIFSEYCSLWKLNVNSSKTKVVIFAGGRFPTNNFNFTFDGNNFEIVSDIVYLGVNFSRTGSYLNTKKRNIDKAYKAMYAVLKRGVVINCLYKMSKKKFWFTMLLKKIF